MGRRIAQFVYLKPEYIDEYKAIHATVWPEVLQAIKESNIVDCMYTIEVCFCVP
jgi:L-rhamnose mutarotase